MRSIAKLLLVLLLIVVPSRSAVVGIYGAELGDDSELDACAGCVIETTSPIRTGNYSLEIPSNTNTANFNGTSGGSPFTIRFYFRFDTVSAGPDTIVILRADNNTSLCIFGLDSDGTFDIKADGGTFDTSASVFSIDTWYRTEIKYTKGSGSDAVCTLWVDGTQEANSTDGTTMLDGQNLNFSQVGTGLVHYDDILLRNDGTLPGPGQIEALRPDDAGDEADSNWDDTIDGTGTACPTGTGTTCSVNLSNNPFNDATGSDRTSSGAGNMLLDVTTITDVGTINSFSLGARIKKGSGGGGTVHALRVLISGGSAESSGDFNPATSFDYFSFVPPTQPSSQADLDGIQIGVHHDGAQDYDFGDAWGMVDYTPEEGGPASKIFIITN